MEILTLICRLLFWEYFLILFIVSNCNFQNISNFLFIAFAWEMGLQYFCRYQRSSISYLLEESFGLHSKMSKNVDLISSLTRPRGDRFFIYLLFSVARNSVIKLLEIAPYLGITAHFQQLYLYAISRFT